MMNKLKSFIVVLLMSIISLFAEVDSVIVQVVEGLPNFKQADIPIGEYIKSFSVDNNKIAVLTANNNLFIYNSSLVLEKELDSVFFAANGGFPLSVKLGGEKIYLGVSNGYKQNLLILDSSYAVKKNIDPLKVHPQTWDYKDGFLMFINEKMSFFDVKIDTFSVIGDYKLPETDTLNRYFICNNDNIITLNQTKMKDNQKPSTIFNVDEYSWWGKNIPIASTADTLFKKYALHRSIYVREPSTIAGYNGNICIIGDRYMGLYEGTKWIAIPFKQSEDSWTSQYSVTDSFCNIWTVGQVGWASGVVKVDPKNRKVFVYQGDKNGWGSSGGYLGKIAMDVKTNIVYHINKACTKLTSWQELPVAIKSNIGVKYTPKTSTSLPAGIYTLRGVKMKKNITLNNLPKGVYFKVRKTGIIKKLIIK